MSEENNVTDLEVVIPISSEVVYQMDRSLIDSMVATARAFPRNIQRAKKNCIDIVSIDQKTAQTCTYSVPRAGGAVTGPSVHMAKIVAQQWGNLRIEAKVVDISATHVTSEGICFDLETNVAIKTQVKRSIMTKAGKRFAEDLITVTGNAANSIALRNAIYAVIPRPIIDAVYGAVQQTITGDVSDDVKLKKRAREIVDKMMGAYNVTEAQVLAIVGKAAIEYVTAEDLTTLIGVGTAIKDGDTTIEKAFSGNKAELPKTEHAGDTNDRAKQLVESATSVKELESRLKTMPKKMKEDLKELIADKTDSLERAEFAEKERIAKESEEADRTA